MLLTVIGATGGTGRELVKIALEQGHNVIALARNPEQVRIRHNCLSVVKGDALNTVDLDNVLQPGAVVISTLGLAGVGSTGNGPPDLCERFAAALLERMRVKSVERLIAVSTAFLFDSHVLPFLVGRLFFRQVVRDARAMEFSIRQSPAQWTIVRPPRLTDAPARNRYRVRAGDLPPFGFSIGRADLAGFLLREAEDAAFIRQVVGVAD